MVTRNLPPVTIGIPFYNDERFLMDAIKSVFAQTHQNWELILMDDGSTDRSLEIARSIDDPRVRVFSDGHNKKLAARLNEIHALAKYDFVARMDADDMMATNRIEKQLIFLEEHPEYDLVTTGVCSITDESIPYGIRLPPEGNVLTPYKTLSGVHGITHASITGKKDWFIRNPYDPKDHWGEDYRLWVRTQWKNDLPMGFISEPLYYYREEGSMTPEKMLLAQRNCREVIRARGPEMAGLSRTAYLIGRSCLKSLVIRSFATFRATDAIVRARSPVVDEREFVEVQADISRIKATGLPTGFRHMREGAA